MLSNRPRARASHIKWLKEQLALTRETGTERAIRRAEERLAKAQNSMFYPNIKSYSRRQVNMDITG